MSIKLSILVITVPSRIDFFYPRIMKQILSQAQKYSDVEVIAFFDNKKRTTGAKRQCALNLAQGEFLTFIDDDDRISDHYVDYIMSALSQHPDTDTVVFNCICCVNNGPVKKLCKYGVEFEYGDINDGTEWRGLPAHTMVWRSTLAKSHTFSDMQNGEDYDWVKRAVGGIKKQVRVDEVLYYYDANYTTTSETSFLSEDFIKSNINKLIEEENLKDPPK